jgi:hypothetical protein
MARFLVCAALSFGFALFASSPAIGVPLIAELFDRTGQSETLSAPLAQFGGVTTSGDWSGLVEVTASGVGANFPAIGGFTDSFYYYIPGDPDIHLASRDDQNWGLRISETGCAAAAECGAPSILHYIVFSELLGEVTPPPVGDFLVAPATRNAVMPYRDDHLYRFVIDLGAAPHRLTIGYGDGGVFDNSGAFDITLHAVTRATVFAPPAILLVAVSCAAFVCCGHRGQGGPKRVDIYLASATPRAKPSRHAPSAMG